MGKIIKLKTNTDNVLDFLESIKKAVEEDKVKNMIIIGKCENGRTIIGNTRGLSWCEKIELKSHLETNIINDMIKENYVTPE